jgi:predicted MFS family arabinose efflux permease
MQEIDSSGASSAALGLPARSDRLLAILAMILLANPGATTGTILPVVVDSLAASGTISLSLSLTLAATQMACVGVALLATSICIHWIDRRLVGGTSLMIAIAGTLATIVVQDPGGLILCRSLVGAGCGVAYAIAVASLAASANSSRNFGLFMATNQISGILILSLLPWLTAMGGLRYSMTALALFIGLCCAALPWLPMPPSHLPRPGNSTFNTHRSFGRSALLGFVSMFLLAAAFGACWPIVGQIAKSHGALDRGIAFGFALAGFGGVLGGLASAWVAPRLGDARVLTLGSLAFTASIALQAIPNSNFAVAAATLMFFCTFNIPNYLNFVGKLDNSGRLPILMTALMQLGMAAGQAAVASLSAARNFPSIILFAATLAALAWLTVIYTTQLVTKASA